MAPLSKHIPYLDGWRGIAVACVFFGHFVSSPKYWWVGAFGVQLFFVLSGYLMSDILFIKKVALADFFASRAIRVLSTFLLFIGALLLYAALFQPVPYMPSGEEVLSTITFTRTYFPSDLALDNKNWPIAHLWSLNVKEHSYVFLALLALVTRQANRRWLTTALLLGATALAWFISYKYFASPPKGPNLFFIRSECASLGLLASATLRYTRNTFPSQVYARVPGVFPLLCIAIAFVCVSTYQYRGYHVTVAPLLLACAINFLDRVPEFVRHALSTRALCWLGTCCFSLYLWQQPLHVLRMDYGMNPYLMFAVAVGIGMTSFYLFEDPIRKSLTSAWRKRRQVTAPHTSAVVHGAGGGGVIRMLDE